VTGKIQPSLWKCGLDSSYSGHGQVASYPESSNDVLGFIKCLSTFIS
jgi:hypothetical protein